MSASALSRIKSPLFEPLMLKLLCGLSVSSIMYCASSLFTSAEVEDAIESAVSGRS